LREIGRAYVNDDRHVVVVGGAEYAAQLLAVLRVVVVDR